MIIFIVVLIILYLGITMHHFSQVKVEDIASNNAWTSFLWPLFFVKKTLRVIYNIVIIILLLLGILILGILIGYCLPFLYALFNKNLDSSKLFEFLNNTYRVLVCTAENNANNLLNE